MYLQARACPGHMEQREGGQGHRADLPWLGLKGQGAQTGAGGHRPALSTRPYPPAPTSSATSHASPCPGLRGLVNDARGALVGPPRALCIVVLNSESWGGSLSPHPPGLDAVFPLQLTGSLLQAPDKEDPCSSTRTDTTSGIFSSH